MIPAARFGPGQDARDGLAMIPRESRTAECKAFIRPARDDCVLASEHGSSYVHVRESSRASVFGFLPDSDTPRPQGWVQGLADNHASIRMCPNKIMEPTTRRTLKLDSKSCQTSFRDMVQASSTRLEWVPAGDDARIARIQLLRSECGSVLTENWPAVETDSSG